jgi:hypothetical protein
MNEPVIILPIDLLPPLTELLFSFTEAFDASHNGAAARVTRAVVELPIEIDLMSIGGELALRASAPTQRTETTVLPVLHRLTFTLALESEDGDRDR